MTGPGPRPSRAAAEADANAGGFEGPALEREADPVCEGEGHGRRDGVDQGVGRPDDDALHEPGPHTGFGTPVAEGGPGPVHGADEEADAQGAGEPDHDHARPEAHGGAQFPPREIGRAASFQVLREEAQPVRHPLRVRPPTLPGRLP